MTIADQLRLATALAHCVPGVALEITCHRGDTFVVAHHRLDAAANPCQLRAAILAEPLPGLRRFVDTVAAVEIAGGLCDIGAGVHQRAGDRGEERWFATFLALEQTSTLLEGCQLASHDDGICIDLKPDPQLGVTVAGLSCVHPSRSGPLDEVAFWASAACMVEEFVHELEIHTFRDRP